MFFGLHDCRKASPSNGASMRVVLGDGKAQLLLIPRGVAHGAANLTTQRQILMYFVNQQFSAEAPDEHRLDPFLLGREFELDPTHLHQFSPQSMRTLLSAFKSVEIEFLEGRRLWISRRLMGTQMMFAGRT